MKSVSPLVLEIGKSVVLFIMYWALLILIYLLSISVDWLYFSGRSLVIIIFTPIVSGIFVTMLGKRIFKAKTVTIWVTLGLLVVSLLAFYYEFIGVSPVYTHMVG
jgi:hypothetical protein